MDYKIYLIEKKDKLSFFFANHIPFLKNNNFSFERIKIDDLEKRLISGNTDFHSCILEYDFDKYYEDKVENLLKHFPMGARVHIAFDSKKHSENDSTQFKKILNNVIVRSVVDLSLHQSLYLPFIRELIFNQKQYYSNPISVNDLDKLGNKFDESIVEMQKQLNRVKDFHREFAPKRFEEIRGVEFYSKFLAGLSSGGEFFDLIRIGSSILLFISSTSSYITSGVVLKHYSEIKNWESSNLDKIKKFIRAVETDINEIIKKNVKKTEYKTQLLIANLDLNTLKLVGYNFGNCSWVTNVKNATSLPQNDFPIGESFCNQAYFEYKLRRSEKMLFVSPGLKKDFEELLPRENIYEIFKNNLHLSSIDLINEIYYQLKKENSSDFLSYDASAILIEVQNDIITQV
ncbi:MAG: hypothetical protein U0T83_00750 [Bacteriovoracaceae bacterium]